MEKKIFWAGDSTVKENNYTSFPQTGMGQAFGLFVKKNYRIVNCAQNGRSTKSFIDEGRLDSISKSIGEGDYLFIQFGHNDEKADEARHTDSFGSYQENLKKYVDVAVKAKAHPLLITPIYRRLFNEDNKTLKENNHLDYPDAMIALAKELNIPVIDMCSITKKMIEDAGFEATKEWYLHVPAGKYPNFPDGKEDNSHLRYEGAYRYCNALANEIKKLSDEYSEMLLEADSDLEDPALLID